MNKYRRLDWRDYSLQQLVSELDNRILETFKDYRRSRVRLDDVGEIRWANRQRETLADLLDLRAVGLDTDSQYRLARHRSLYRNAGPAYDQFLDPFWRKVA